MYYAILYAKDFSKKIAKNELDRELKEINPPYNLTMTL